jgi:hypothetical protein
VGHDRRRSLAPSPMRGPPRAVIPLNRASGHPMVRAWPAHHCGFAAMPPATAENRPGASGGCGRRCAVARPAPGFVANSRSLHLRLRFAGRPHRHRSRRRPASIRAAAPPRPETRRAPANHRLPGDAGHRIRGAAHGLAHRRRGLGVGARLSRPSGSGGAGLLGVGIVGLGRGLVSHGGGGATRWTDCGPPPNPLPPRCARREGETIQEGLASPLASRYSLLATCYLAPRGGASRLRRGDSTPPFRPTPVGAAVMAAVAVGVL